MPTLRMATLTLLNLSARFLLAASVICLGLLSVMIVIVEKVQVRADEVRFLSVSA